MPKLYEYFGLIVLFYSNEHEPIHVHGRKEDRESKAEISYEGGRFKEIKIRSVKGKRPLKKNELRNFRKLLKSYREDIVNKWIDFFIYNREIKPERITRKIK
jgi:hypothetical protein